MRYTGGCVWMMANRAPDDVDNYDDEEEEMQRSCSEGPKVDALAMHRGSLEQGSSCPKYALLLLVTHPAALERSLEVHAPVLLCSVNPYELVYRDRPSPSRS